MLGFPTQGPARTQTVRPRLTQLEERDVPALFGVGDTFNAQAGQVLSVPSNGILANDFSDTTPGGVIEVLLTSVTPPRYVGNPQPLPAQSLRVNADGSFSFIVPPADQIPVGVTQVQFDYRSTIRSAFEVSNITTVTINLQIDDVQLIAVGADAGGGPHVRVFESGSGLVRFNFFPFEQTFTGGVRVAAGDLTNDGIDDIAVIPASGGAARVRAFDGLDGSPIVDQLVFDPAFRGGGYVAIGDFNGDGNNDIIVGAGEGGGPRVSVLAFPGGFSGSAGVTTAQVIADFFAFEPGLASGVRVAAGDTRGIGRDFLVVAPGAGGGPEVRVFDGQQILRRPNNPFPVLTFMAGDAGNRDGVFVATGNFRGTGQADILTGSGAGSAVARVFDGRNGGLIREIAVPVDEQPTGGGTASGPNAFPFVTPPGGGLLAPTVRPSSLLPAGLGNPVPGVSNGGARVAATDYNGDGIDDIVVGAGPGNAPRVRVFSGTTQVEIISLLAFSPSFLGGVNVGASS